MTDPDLGPLRQARLRALPSVDELLRGLDGEAGAARPSGLVEAVRDVLDAQRRTLLAAVSVDELAAVPTDGPELRDRVRARLRDRTAWRLDRVINATGVVLHTNLGRAPLAALALERLLVVGGRYTNLELDIGTKTRGSRYEHVDELLCRLTGAEASLVVNNNAAAVLLALVALARDREVVVSRGELIEIGGEFRIPDIMARSGARLVEVGTTNRTRVADYAAAIGPETALLLKVHPSNFRVLGFTAAVSTRELAALGQARGIPVMEDLGSGCLVDLAGPLDEPTVGEVVAAGADLVTFSGDKLLGGPQAGIAVGRTGLVDRLRRDPLNRALRVDKLTLGALEATLSLHEDPVAALGRIPTLRMLTEPAPTVRRRARRCLRGLPASTRRALGAGLLAVRSQVGGGALPLCELESAAVTLGGPERPAAELDQALRRGRPVVIGRVAEGRLLLDCRTVADDEVPLLTAALRALGDGR